MTPSLSLRSGGGNRLQSYRIRIQARICINRAQVANASAIIDNGRAIHEMVRLVIAAARSLSDDLRRAILRVQPLSTEINKAIARADSADTPRRAHGFIMAAEHRSCRARLRRIQDAVRDKSENAKRLGTESSELIERTKQIVEQTRRLLRAYDADVTAGSLDAAAGNRQE